MNDKRCKVCGCLIPDDAILCCRCGDYDDMQTFKPRIQTNGDRIRLMSDEELADFLDDLTSRCQEVQCERCIIGCERNANGMPLCDSFNIMEWVKRRAGT